MEDGYEFFAQRKLLTIFSAPNYCGYFDNAGALMSINDELLCSFQVKFIFNVNYTTNKLFYYRFYNLKNSLVLLVI